MFDSDTVSMMATRKMKANYTKGCLLSKTKYMKAISEGHALNKIMLGLLISFPETFQDFSKLGLFELGSSFNPFTCIIIIIIIILVQSYILIYYNIRLFV